MERLTQRLGVAADALSTLQELLDGPLDDPVRRDAAIQRFEYSFEAVWKAVQRYLADIEGVEVGSPKQAVRVSFQVGLLSEEDAAAGLALVDDRNLTVHTYNEALAEAIASRLPGHAALLGAWLDAARKQAHERS